MFSKEKIKIVPWVAIVIVAFATVAVILAAVAQGQSYQSDEAILPEMAFSGEYRINGGEWQPITKGAHISSTRGNVELKGTFECYYEGQYLGAADNGTQLSL